MKKRLVPELRFPEFSDEWEEKKLGDICDYVDYRGKTPVKVNEGIILVTAKNIKPGYIDYEVSKEYVKKNKYEQIMSRGLPKLGDVLITTEAPCGNVAQIDREDIALAQRVIKYRGKHDLIDNTFLKYTLLSERFQRKLERISTGGTVKGVKGSTLHKTKVLLTSNIKEQTKIANFFTLIDNKIEKQEEKIINLEQYKKGMMQKIFSQEIRFKDENGEDYSEWEWRNLENILVEKNIKCKDNDYQVISSTIKGLYYQKDYFNKDIASNDKSSYKVLEKNQIVFSPQNLWMGNINFNDSIEIGIVSPSYKIYEIRKEYCPEFIGYIIKTPYMLHQYLQSSEQGASVVRRNLNLDLFNFIKVKVPSLQEQRKIANFLTSIDTKIEKETEKLKSIKKLKKGLMQKIFI